MLKLGHQWLIISYRNIGRNYFSMPTYELIHICKSGLMCYHDDVIKWMHFFALLALCAGNSPVTGEFPSQRPVTRSFDVLFDMYLNKWLS